MPRANLLTESQLGEYLNIAPATLKRARARGYNCPPFLKIGRGPAAPVRYDRDEVDAWLANGCPPLAEWPPIWRRLKPAA